MVFRISKGKSKSKISRVQTTFGGREFLWKRGALFRLLKRGHRDTIPLEGDQFKLKGSIIIRKMVINCP